MMCGVRWKGEVRGLWVPTTRTSLISYARHGQPAACATARGHSEPGSHGSGFPVDAAGGRVAAQLVEGLSRVTPGPGRDWT